MLQVDEIAPVTPKKMTAQLCFQIFNPFIIINNLTGSQVQIYFPVDNSQNTIPSFGMMRPSYPFCTSRLSSLAFCMEA